MKTVKLFMFMALTIALPLAFTSCSDDDDDNGGSSSSSSGVSIITTDDGNQYLLRNIGDIFTYVYDSNGRCVNIDGDFTITYNPCVISSLSNDDDYEYTINLTLNNSGYVTKMVSYYSYVDGKDSDTENSTTNFSYDSSGHLTKMETTTIENEIDNNISYQYTGNISSSFTWKNGDLTKVETSEDYSDNGEKSTCTDTYTYEYGNIENKYQQYLLAF
ncbi:MAG: DUF4595 domain-containing protein [Prevotella sp.]|nr:DUF4595 domain-containing protein [Prevotella sp.]